MLPPRAGTGAAAGTAPAGAATTGGAANIIGTVTVIDGTTLYVTDSSGNVVKVTTNTGTTVSKTDTGTVSDLAPGEICRDQRSAILGRCLRGPIGE